MAVWFEIYNIIGYLVFICVFLVQMHVIVHNYRPCSYHGHGSSNVHELTDR